MAWTVAFALLGALLFALLIAPVLCTLLFKDEIKEWRNPVFHWLQERYGRLLDWCFDHMKVTLGIGRGCAGGDVVSGFRWRDRFRVPASPG